MGGHSTSSSTTVNSKQFEDISNILKAGTDIMNEHGTHDIHAGDLGRGVTVYLQNLQQTKAQLQNLGANAVYAPESNSLYILSWDLLSVISLNKCVVVSLKTFRLQKLVSEEIESPLKRSITLSQWLRNLEVSYHRIYLLSIFPKKHT